jgi:TolB-like protein/Flp pilus assembly protein TadD
MARPKNAPIWLINQRERRQKGVSYTCNTLKIRCMLNAMSPAKLNLDAARGQLERVLISAGFSRNERLSRFLRFIVEQHLEGRDSEIKESVIAIEVFGRKADHDPKQDSIVRTEAARLRARLTEYYANGGKNDSIVIALPKGGYVPVLRQVQAEPLPAASGSPAPRRGRGLRLGLWLVLPALAAGALTWWWAAYHRAPISIAVLPLTNLSPDRAGDYFADGLTDEIIRNLSIIDGMVVRSQTSSFAFKGTAGKVRDIGKQLDVHYVVEGSVLRSGQQLRIDAQLIRVRDDFPLWSDRYDRALTDVFAIQDEISRGIVNSLRLKLGHGRRRYETSTEAYDLYLQARAVPLQHGPNADLEALPRFEQVIAKDPTFAPAYAGLAEAHLARSEDEEFGSADELVKLQSAAQKALELDPLLAEAHAAMAMVYARKAQWKDSEKSFRRALELDPNDSMIHATFVLGLLFPLGRIQEAIQELGVAIKNDPLAPRLRFILANALMAAGRFDEAASYCLGLPADFTGRGEWLARARTGQGRTQEAIGILNGLLQRGDDPLLTVRGFLGYAYGRAGQREQAEKLATEAPIPYDRALIFAGLGDKERTLQALAGMAVLGPVRFGRDLTYPEFDLVRGDPRLEALRKSIGLP